MAESAHLVVPAPARGAVLTLVVELMHYPGGPGDRKGKAVSQPRRQCKYTANGVVSRLEPEQPT